MADVELLPPPEKSEIDRHLPTGVRVYGYTSEDMHAYARANVAHATAPPQAEVEELRAEVERVTCELMDAITRADKLAEALRDAADDIDAGVSPEDAAAHLRARADLLRDQEEGR